MTEPKTAGIYARYSTQLQNPATLRSQIHECRQFADVRGLTVLDDHIYTDEAKSGASTTHRESLHRMLRAVERGPRPFDALLVWKFSRLCRSMADSLIIRAKLEQAGVRLIAVSEPVPEDPALGDLMRNILAAMDAFYLERVASESRRGQADLLRRGFVTGRCPYGYYDERVPDPAGKVRRDGTPVKRLVRHVDPIQAEVVRRIFRLFTAGMGTPRIARQLNDEGLHGPGAPTWSHGAVGRILRNDVYCGRVIFHTTRNTVLPDGTRKRVRRPRDEWHIHEHPELRVVDEVVFQEAQERHRQFRRIAFERRHKHRKHLLSGLLVCAACGTPCTGWTRRRGDARVCYCCRTFRYKGRKACAVNARPEMAALDQRVWRHVMETLEINGFLKALRRRVLTRWASETGRERRADRLLERTERIAREIDRLTTAVTMTGDVAPLVEALRIKRKEADDLSGRRRRLERACPPELDMDRLRELLARLPGMAREVTLLPVLQTALRTAGVSARLHADGHVSVQLAGRRKEVVIHRPSQ